MNAILKRIRLLPVVVILGTGLLAIKGVDIARAAQAASESADPDQPDNSGLAPADNGGKPAPDFANTDTGSASSGEVDVLSSLTRRRTELDARERALDMRENLLNAGEGRVDQKIAALKALQTQIQGLLAQRDAKQDAQIASLVKTYSSMKPKDAARIFNALSDDVLLPVAKGMKSDVLAPVLAAMNPDAAQKLTVKLAALLKLPEAAPAAICPTPTTAADAAPPTPEASDVNPVVTPLQTAALNPPPVVTPAAPSAAATPAPATQAAAAPTPHKPVVRHVTPVKPATANATPPAGKPATTAAATPPVKPMATAAAAASSTTPSAVPATATASAAPPAKPAAPPAATAAPTALTPPAPAPVK